MIDVTKEGKVLYKSGHLPAPRLRQAGKKEAAVCTISTMSDLLEMVESFDKVLVFG